MLSVQMVRNSVQAECAARRPTSRLPVNKGGLLACFGSWQPEAESFKGTANVSCMGNRASANCLRAATSHVIRSPPQSWIL